MKHAKPWMTTAASTGLLALSFSTAQAVICSADNVPAATLLVPHFQVDLDNCGSGTTTLITVRNASPDAVVARVNLWTNLSRPVTGFPIYLDAYATVDMNLADVFCSGTLPQTDPDITGQPTSNLGNPPVQRRLCPGPGTGQLLESPGPIPADFLQTVRAYHTGQISPQTGQTAGVDFGDNVARGFVTVDTVSECSLLLAGDFGYFDTIISHENVLLGEYRLVDTLNNFSQGQRAVAIEAADAGIFNPGDKTFYGFYLNQLALDRREPLPSTFFSHVSFGNTLGQPNTSLSVWRESGGDNLFPVTPGLLPNPFPLSAEEIVYFTIDDNAPVIPPVTLPGEPAPVPGLIPWASQLMSDIGLAEVGFGTEAIDNLLYTNLQSTANFGRIQQSWVSTIDSSEGRFSGMSGSFPLDNGCDAGKIITISSAGTAENNPKDPDQIFRDRFAN
jgi:hypothetical protein